MDNPKVKEHAHVARVNVTVSVSVHRGTAVFDDLSMNPQMLTTDKEISTELEKSLKQPSSSPRHAVSEDSLDAHSPGG